LELKGVEWKGVEWKWVEWKGWNLVGRWRIVAEKSEKVAHKSE